LTIPQADYYVSLIAKRTGSDKRKQNRSEAMSRAKQTDSKKLEQYRREMEENRKRLFQTTSPEAIAARLKQRK
jgi:hypothetical protein